MTTDVPAAYINAITQSKHNGSVIVSQKGFHKELINKYSEDIKGIRSYKVPRQSHRTLRRVQRFSAKSGTQER